MTVPRLTATDAVQENRVSLSDEQLIVLSRLLNEALELPDTSHEDWLRGLAAPESELRDTLRELLSQRARFETNEFLNTLPPLDLVGPLGPSYDEQIGLQPGAAVGPYELVRILGTGGMGGVWLAIRKDGSIKRPVALKLPYSALQGEVLGERFSRERDILASLAHPNIARLYDAGITATGQPYLSLEYVDGVPLTEFCDAQRLPIRKRLEVFLQVLAAVQYAHSHLVIHRDIKPSNILVTAEGQVMLLDFGIAKLMVDGRAKETELTLHGGRALTPDYASPEQILGQPLSTASDVYALGVVLYELLTGERPYQLKRDSRGALEDAVLSAQAPAPSQAVRDEPKADARASTCRRISQELVGDLDTITLKALKKAPGDRYQNAADLADDLNRYLHDEPVRARPDSRWYRSRKFVSRHKLGVGSVAAILVALTIGLSIMAWQARRIAEQRDIARSALAREEAVRSYLTRMFRASAAKHGEDPPTAKAMLDQSAKRVLSEYRDDPYLAGKVVETLADLYGALKDAEGQIPLLEGFLAQAGAVADPQAVAGVQQRLAEVEMLKGDPARAMTLLDAAEAYWQKTPQRYPEERLVALGLRARLQNESGHKQEAVATFQRAIEARIAFSGPNHRETAVLYNSLALALSELNRGEEAQAAFKRGLEILRGLGQADDLDALVMPGNSGWLALRLGHLEEAASTLRTAFEKERAIAGDSAVVAVAMSLYGSALSIYGKYADAIALLHVAGPMAERYAGVGSAPDIRTRQFLSEALWSAGDHAEAKNVLARALAVSREHHPEDHPLNLGLRVDAARFSLAEGRYDEAQRTLVDLPSQYRKLGPAGISGLGRVLVLQGELLLTESRPADAIAPLAEAVQLRVQTRWNQSWELAEARARLGEAYASMHDPRASAPLEDAVAVLQSQLGDSHAQTARAKRALSAARSLASMPRTRDRIA